MPVCVECGFEPPYTDGWVFVARSRGERLRDDPTDLPPDVWRFCRATCALWWLDEETAVRPEHQAIHERLRREQPELYWRRGDLERWGVVQHQPRHRPSEPT